MSAKVASSGRRLATVPSAPSSRRARAVVQAVTEACAPILAARGAELDRLEYVPGPGRSVLRLFVDKPGGVTVEDCASISRQLGAFLETEDTVPGSYVLEVSSPGLTRPLRGRQDFERFAGRLVLVHARKPVSGKRRSVTGRLQGVDGDDVVISVSTDRETETLRIPIEDVAQARLEVEA